MNILVTGGAGYIGRYICDLLVEDNQKVIIVDNLSTGDISGVNKSATFYQYDIRNKEQMEEVFSKHDVDVVIHMAALIKVEESGQIPYEYYDVNVTGTLVLLEAMKNHNCNNIVFSSTAAVYGDADLNSKIEEDYITNPINVYGKSKLYGENIIESGDIYGLNHIIFRYFNVAGGKKMGYEIEKFSTLIPNIISATKNGYPVTVFGDDYPSQDGTCIRDFIHVVDLAKAHILAAHKLVENGKELNGVYNLGSSKGFSVFDIVKASETAIGKKVDYKVGPRRNGDIFYSVASSKKANEKLGWQTEVNNVEDIIEDMWKQNTEK